MNLNELYRTFSEHSRMVLVNVKTFLVLQILFNLVYMQNFFVQITADVSKIWKSVPVTILLKTGISFVYSLFAFEIGNVFNFRKTRFC